MHLKPIPSELGALNSPDSILALVISLCVMSSQGILFFPVGEVCRRVTVGQGPGKVLGARVCFFFKGCCYNWVHWPLKSWGSFSFLGFGVSSGSEYDFFVGVG